jgi:hypothetical protein
MERGLRGIGAFAAKGSMERTRCYCEPLALMVHARVEPGGKANGFPAVAKERSRQDNVQEGLWQTAKLCRTSFGLPTEKSIANFHEAEHCDLNKTPPHQGRREGHAWQRATETSDGVGGKGRHGK